MSGGVCSGAATVAGGDDEHAPIPYPSIDEVTNAWIVQHPGGGWAHLHPKLWPMLLAAFPDCDHSIKQTLQHYDDVLQNVLPYFNAHPARRGRALYDIVHMLNMSLAEWKAAAQASSAEVEYDERRRRRQPNPEEARGGAAAAAAFPPQPEDARPQEEEQPATVEVAVEVAESGERIRLAVPATSTVQDLALMLAARNRAFARCDLYAHNKRLAPTRELRSCGVRCAPVLVATGALLDRFYMGLWLARRQFKATLQQVVAGQAKEATAACDKILLSLDALEADTDAKRADRKAEVKNVQALLDVLDPRASHGSS